MNNLIIHPDSTQKLKAIKTVLKALEIPFEEQVYDPGFVAEIIQAEQDIKDGKGVQITTTDLWK